MLPAPHAEHTAGQPQATAEQARALTDRLKLAVEATWQLVKQAYVTRAWAALGYATWDDYLTREFGDSRIRIPREERPEAVASMHESGMSNRAIAAAAGVSEATVRRELSTASNDAVGQQAVTSEPQGGPVPAAPRAAGGTGDAGQRGT